VRTSFTVVACHSDWTRTTRVSTHCINAIRSVPTWSWAASIHVWKISVSDWKSWQLFEFYFFSLVSFLVLYFKTVVESRMSLHLYQYVINNVQWNKNTLNNYTLEFKTFMEHKREICSVILYHLRTTPLRSTSTYTIYRQYYSLPTCLWTELRSWSWTTLKEYSNCKISLCNKMHNVLSTLIHAFDFNRVSQMNILYPEDYLISWQKNL